MDRCSITGLENVPEAARNCVLTIGNFDGVHVGHQKILQACRSRADQTGLSVVALTLHPHPAVVLHPDRRSEYLIPPELNCRFLLEAGADFVITARTDDSLLDMAPEEFVKCVIVKRFAPACIVEGSNFFFGLARSGTTKTLQRAGEFEGFDVEVVGPVSVELSEGLQRVSSTLIRSLIRAGRVEDAASCLGRNYALFGEVVSGEGKGRLLEFPTANIDVGEQVIPADGVYVGVATIEGKALPAAVSIGEKPTLGPSARTVEAHLIDEDQAQQEDFYGKDMVLSFIHRLRDQAKFAGPDDLRAQIAKDVESVRRIYSERI